MGVKLILSWHYNKPITIGQDLNEYFNDVNAVLKIHNSSALAFNPDPYQ